MHGIYSHMQRIFIYINVYNFAYDLSQYNICTIFYFIILSLPYIINVNRYPSIHVLFLPHRSNVDSGGLTIIGVQMFNMGGLGTLLPSIIIPSTVTSIGRDYYYYGEFDVVFSIRFYIAPL